LAIQPVASQHTAIHAWRVNTSRVDPRRFSAWRVNTSRVDPRRFPAWRFNPWRRNTRRSTESRFNPSRSMRGDPTHGALTRGDPAHVDAAVNTLDSVIP